MGEPATPRPQQHTKHLHRRQKEDMIAKGRNAENGELEMDRVCMNMHVCNVRNYEWSSR